jgi:hypothetical protein
MRPANGDACAAAIARIDCATRFGDGRLAAPSTPAAALELLKPPPPPAPRLPREPIAAATSDAGPAADDEEEEEAIAEGTEPVAEDNGRAGP